MVNKNNILILFLIFTLSSCDVIAPILFSGFSRPYDCLKHQEGTPFLNTKFLIPKSKSIIYIYRNAECPSHQFENETVDFFLNDKFLTTIHSKGFTIFQLNEGNYTIKYIYSYYGLNEDHSKKQNIKQIKEIKYLFKSNQTYYFNWHTQGHFILFATK